MSKGSEIHKRFGLKFVVAYRIRKARKKIKNKILSNPFLLSYIQPLLMLYHLVTIQKNLKAFGIYRTLRKQNTLIPNPKHLRFVLSCYGEILEWLESKEFQGQYLDTNHPYPPLLNPKRLVRDSQNPYANLSYENICAELAWEMNLPLPPYYDLIWLRLDGSGSSAYGRFMKLCGINKINADDAILNNKIFHYYPCYQQLLAHKDSYNLIAIHEYWHESYMKFCALIDKNVPAICNIRDQIERLKHGVNHLNSWECTSLNKFFNLTCEYANLFPILSYDACTPTIPPKNFDSNVPLLNALYNYSSKGWRGASIQFYKRLKYLKNLTHIEYIDMSEISKDKAFDTWTRLANQFGFTPPKLEDKYIFEGRINNNTGEFMHFPVTLYAHSDDVDKTAQDLMSLNLKGGIKITLTLKQRITQNRDNFTDITPLIFEIPLKYDEIRILVKTKNYPQLIENHKLFLRVKDFLIGYIKAYEKELEKIKNAHITPKQIIEYLAKKEHTHLRNAIRDSLKKSLLDVQNKRPDIVASWKYYQEFEKMCEEIDK